MNKIHGFIVMSCVLLLALSSCSDLQNVVSEDAETTFLTTLPTKDVNESLRLSVEGYKTTFHFGSEIPLIVYNLSPSSIVLDGGTHIKLVALQDTEWIEVENELTYSGEKILSPKGIALLDQGGTLIQPAVKQEDDMLLRAVVIGELTKDNIRTGDLVAAYVDIYLTP